MDILTEQLAPGEKIIWDGKPNKASFVRLGSWLMIPFSIVWLAFVCVWEALAIASGAPLFFDLFGLIFVGVGLYAAVGRFFVAGHIWNNLHYFLTNKRAIIQRGASDVQSVELGKFDNIRLKLKKAGNGTIIFQSMGFDFYIPGIPMRNMMYAEPIAFYVIDDVKNVYDQIQQIKNAGGQS